MFENETLGYSNEENKTCTDCYYWWQRECINTKSKNYGIEMKQNDSCVAYENVYDRFKENIDDLQKNTCGSCSYFKNDECMYIGENECILMNKECEKVDHPHHYNKGIEAIDIIESWGLNFSLGNAIKYILRAPHKGNQLEDLKKASWYINREIQRLENNK